MTDAPPRGRGLIPAILALLIGGALAAYVHVRSDALERRVDELSARVTEATDVLRLIRLEGVSEGKGIDALIEQIRAWAPELETAGTPDPRAEWVVQRLEQVLEAVDAMGPSAFSPLVAELEQEAAKKDPNDEVRKWLLRAAHRADRDRGVDLYVDVVRGTRLNPSQRLRFAAYDDLAAIDRPRAANVLAQILQIESAQGITRQVPPALQQDYEHVVGTNRFPQFFNFIGRFANSGHPETETILLMLLGRAEHDRMTYQATIKELGTLKAEAAVPKIKELYHRPPGATMDPIFRATCLHAIAEIQGAEACDWMREQLRTERDPMLVQRLQDLVKTHCP